MTPKTGEVKRGEEMAETEHPAPWGAKYPMHDLYKSFAKMKRGGVGRQPPAATGIYISEGSLGLAGSACAPCQSARGILKQGTEFQEKQRAGSHLVERVHSPPWLIQEATRRKQ